ncbi:MAG: inorganic diphosphatase [Polyangiales bacterium]
MKPVFPFSLEDTISVRIEVPRGSRVKRSASGRVEFVSPIRCPYNYGSVEGERLAPDGDAYDALVLGRRLPCGHLAEGRLLGVVDFLDRGTEDPKLVIGVSMSPADRASVSRFFRRYARIKRLLRFTRETQFRGWMSL